VFKSPSQVPAHHYLVSLPTHLQIATKQVILAHLYLLAKAGIKQIQMEHLLPGGIIQIILIWK
tara:strand:- start:503 stop:691 length:189 start_codon:yes stop_codon:yes gene_type:complete